MGIGGDGCFSESGGGGGVTHILHSRILDRAMRQFDVPVIQNNLRGLYVEFMVAELLGDGWRHSGSDWAAFDLEHSGGTRVEVKQSAALQTWSAPANRSRRRSFNIRTPKVEWVGSVATPRSARVASIYVFAWHDDDTAQADQRDAGQWKFYVVAARSLPDQQTISLSALTKLAKPVGAGQLKPSVEAMLKEGLVQ